MTTATEDTFEGAKSSSCQSDIVRTSNWHALHNQPHQHHRTGSTGTCSLGVSVEEVEHVPRTLSQADDVSLAPAPCSSGPDSQSQSQPQSQSLETALLDLSTSNDFDSSADYIQPAPSVGSSRGSPHKDPAQGLSFEAEDSSQDSGLPSAHHQYQPTPDLLGPSFALTPIPEEFYSAADDFETQIPDTMWAMGQRSTWLLGGKAQNSVNGKDNVVDANAADPPFSDALTGFRGPPTPPGSDVDQRTSRRTSMSVDDRVCLSRSSSDSETSSEHHSSEAAGEEETRNEDCEHSQGHEVGGQGEQDTPVGDLANSRSSEGESLTTASAVPESGPSSDGATSSSTTKPTTAATGVRRARRIARPQNSPEQSTPAPSAPSGGQSQPARSGASVIPAPHHPTLPAPLPTSWDIHNHDFPCTKAALDPSPFPQTLWACSHASSTSPPDFPGSPVVCQGPGFEEPPVHQGRQRDVSPFPLTSWAATQLPREEASIGPSRLSPVPPTPQQGAQAPMQGIPEGIRVHQRGAGTGVAPSHLCMNSADAGDIQGEVQLGRMDLARIRTGVPERPRAAELYQAEVAQGGYWDPHTHAGLTRSPLPQHMHVWGREPCHEIFAAAAERAFGSPMRHGHQSAVHQGYTQHPHPLVGAPGVYPPSAYYQRGMERPAHFMGMSEGDIIRAAQGGFGVSSRLGVEHSRSSHPSGVSEQALATEQEMLTRVPSSQEASIVDGTQMLTGVNHGTVGSGAWDASEVEMARRAGWRQRAVYQQRGSAMVYPAETVAALEQANSLRGIRRSSSVTSISSSLASEPYSVRSVDTRSVFSHHSMHSMNSVQALPLSRHNSRVSRTVSATASEMGSVHSIAHSQHDLTLVRGGGADRGGKFWEVASVAAGAAVLIAGVSAVASGTMRRRGSCGDLPSQGQLNSRSSSAQRSGATVPRPSSGTNQGGVHKSGEKGTGEAGITPLRVPHKAMPAGVVQGEEFLHAQRPHLHMSSGGDFEVQFPVSNARSQNTQQWKTRGESLCSAEFPGCTPLLPEFPPTREPRQPAPQTTRKSREGTFLKLSTSKKASIYEVKPGDTIARIAGSRGKQWQDVAEQNSHIQNPHVIYPHDRLLL